MQKTIENLAETFWRSDEHIAIHYKEKSYNEIWK